LSSAAWESLLDWLEDVEDILVVRNALAGLEQAGGDPAQAGWLAWDEVKDEWEDDDV